MKFYDQYKKLTHSFIGLKKDETLVVKLQNTYGPCIKCKIDNYTKCFGFGDLNPMFMFIGMGPSQLELSTQRIFSDNMNKWVAKYVNFLGKSFQLKNNIYYTNLLLCCVPGDGVKETKNCKLRLEKEIHEVSPKYIILLGENVVRGVFGTTVELNDLREKTHSLKFKGKYYKVFVTHSPKELVLNRDEYASKIMSDLKFIVKEVSNDRESHKNI